MVVSQRKWVLLLAFFVGLVVLGRPLELTSGRPAPNRPFTDLAPDQAYAEAIVDLADRGIVSGFDDGTFKPQAPVMRQQFAKMLAITFGFPVSQEDVCLFVDVGMGGADTFYPDKYIAVGASRGVFLGTSPTLFSPYANMTRLQMVSMVVRAIDSLRRWSAAFAQGGGRRRYGASPIPSMV